MILCYEEHHKSIYFIFCSGVAAVYLCKRKRTPKKKAKLSRQKLTPFQMPVMENSQKSGQAPFRMEPENHILM